MAFDGPALRRSAGWSPQVLFLLHPFGELPADGRSSVLSLASQVVEGFDQAAPADAVNAAAFFLTNSCTPRGACPVRVSTSSDIRS